MRLTLDWDTPEDKGDHLETIRERYDDQPWELRRSSSGNGWHLVVYDLLNNTRSGIDSNENLREVYDDDPKRLKLDRKRWGTGSPFYQVLYGRKYMERDEWPAEDGTGYSTGHAAEVVEQSPAVKAAPERERIKDESGRLDYNKITDLLVDRYGSVKALADKQGVSRRTVYRWINRESSISTQNRKGLRRKARSQALGHYAETEDGSGQAAEEVRFIDPEDERRTLVEYVDVPLDFDIGGDDREYGLLNIHTGSFNDNHTDRQLKAVHEDVADQALAILSPTNPTTGQSLNLDEQNTHFSGVSGWEREFDSVNWERELLDDGEADVYINNLPNSPEKPENPRNYPIFEILLWDEDMSSIEWQVIGIWTGSDPSDAVILKDTGLGNWNAA